MPGWEEQGGKWNLQSKDSEALKEAGQSSKTSGAGYQMLAPLRDVEVERSVPPTTVPEGS
jgi:hypothetical protein